MEPFVTIITPTYNLLENNLADDFNLLISLLDLQTYPNIEHLVIDNASNDGTIEMLKNYKNLGFFKFYSERDTGKFNAYNKGVMRAKGKYVAFLSCDDFIHDITSIYDIVNVLEANNADFSFAPAYCRHPEGFVFLFAPAMHNAFQVMPCARQAMFFKKSMIEKENYFDEKFKTMSDFDFIMRIIMKGYKPVYFDGNYVTYKLGTKPLQNPQRSEEESKAIYYKNFRSLYPMDDNVLDQMAQYSAFPQPLLEKLSRYFPEADRELFFARCEEMHQLRVNAKNTQQQL
ncbi:MAG TPA: glycosyltransferase [Candidatus Stercorousia faecigallinarum]|nr:glycosyltransferase [Candidatus Stercorousia faecigallinarum]